MKQEIDAHLFTEMLMDLDPQIHKPEYLLNAKNIRLTTRGDSTDLAITTEKSTELIELNQPIKGVYLGHCVINSILVIFTKRVANSELDTSTDYIYSINKDNNYEVVELYNGSLGFNLNYPIETIPFYESENILKVYWTDGINQPRMINIINIDSDGNKIKKWNDTSFDFSPVLALKEDVSITKHIGATGMFHSGVILYCFTYYNKYGQETNIAYLSPLVYISLNDRAGKLDEIISCAFTIKIKNLDTNFDFVRIYSILRTSLNTTPTAKRVADINISDIQPVEIDGKMIKVLEYTDNGMVGDTIDPQELIYKGSEEITVLSICLKNNTLFLGNIQLKRPSLLNIKLNIKNLNIKINTDSRALPIQYNLIKDRWYPDEFTLNLKDVIENSTEAPYINPATFKLREFYRFGILLLYKTGKWSEPIFILDYLIESMNLGSYVPMPYANIDLREAYKLGYKKVRGVVVFPTLLERKIITQGILCPTVYSIKSRENHSPDVLSSWFIRPFTRNRYILNFGPIPPSLDDEAADSGDIGSDSEEINPDISQSEDARPPMKAHSIWNENSINEPLDLNVFKFLSDEEKWYNPTLDFSYDTILYDGIKYRGALLWRHDRIINSSGVCNGEIQGVTNVFNNYKPTHSKKEGEPEEFISYFYTKDPEKTGLYDVNLTHINDTNSIFAVDQSILTMHSSDIEFDIDNFMNLKFEDCSFNIIGYTEFINAAFDSDILTSSPTISNDSTGFNRIQSIENQADYPLTSAPLYFDYFVDSDNGKLYQQYPPPTTANKNELKEVKYIIYPWHKTGSLNNDTVRPANEGTQSAELKIKKISNTKIGSIVQKLFNTDGKDYSKLVDLNYINVFNSDLIDLIKLGNTIYFGNIDTLLIPPLSYNFYFFALYRLTYLKFAENLYYTTNKNTVLGEMLTSDLLPYGWKNSDFEDNPSSSFFTKSTIRMKYKSTPHLVISLGTNLEDFDYNYITNTDNSLRDKCCLYIGEIIRNSNPTFGGTSEDALKSNLWIPAGDAININEDDSTGVYWKYGDTFIQRYDFLKTYPFTNEDPNQIIEVGSFTAENRVNADGRCDRNKGQSSNLNISPLNFNLYNPVYNQLNNFFNYRMMDEDYYKLTEYPASLTWTLEHSPSEEVDNWTHITLASMLDLDGSKGSLNSLNIWNDMIFAFLDTTISIINFNSRVQIATLDGVPIEISNSGKVDGYSVKTNSIGCSNKWSILNVPLGLYFIDSNTKDLYHISNEYPANISSNKRMSNWFKAQDSSVWGLNRGVRSFYDYNHSDLYISTKDTVLNYSELSGGFISFFDYHQAISLFNITEDFYGLVYDKSQDAMQLHKLFAKDYPTLLLGKFYPYSISFISKGQTSRIFSNIEFNVDWRDLTNLSDGKGIDLNSFFDTLLISNEYQDSGVVSLLNLKHKTSNLRAKFRAWNIALPRDKTHKRDRIYNRWAKITLEKNNINELSKPMLLHNLAVLTYQ